jgi:hypothetical protein
MLAGLRRLYVVQASCAHSLAALSTSAGHSSAQHSGNLGPSSSGVREQAWSEAEYLQGYEEQEEEHQDHTVDRQHLLRQLLRRTHAAEVRDGCGTAGRPC